MIIHLEDKKKAITAPDDIAGIVMALLGVEDEIEEDKEHLWVFHLNTRNQIKTLELVSLGTLTTSLAHPREIFTRAVANRSAAIILAHNHPSGDPEPSTQDIEMTENLVKAGSILGIELYDHVIVTKEEYRSLKQLQLM